MRPLRRRLSLRSGLAPGFARALAVGLALGLAACGDPPKPTGVLLISIDSLRADHLSCYGYRSQTAPSIKTTPNIDRRLASEGLVFDKAISTTNWTLPSHMALLTGMPNELHGVRKHPDRLHESRQLLAEVFSGAGWRTGGFWSGPNLDPFFGFDRGFETYVDCSSSKIPVPENAREIDMEDLDQVLEARQSLGVMHDASHEGQTSPELVKAFGEWFEGVGAEEPFFAFVHMWDVHYDYEPPPEYDVFDPGYRGSRDGRDVDKIDVRNEPPGERDLQRIVSLYDGEIRYTDHHVGLMLDRLEAAGRLDDTLIVLTADHGEEFMDHDHFGHLKTLFEELVRIPLIMRFPQGVPSGERRQELVGLVDVAPTILELCQLPRPELMWGRSLVPAFRGELPARPLPMEATTIDRKRESPSGLARYEQRGVHFGDEKVYRLPPGNTDFHFDLKSDPGEHQGRRNAEFKGGHPRVREARDLWKGLDQAATILETNQDGEMPENLVEDLKKHGYMDED